MELRLEERPPKDPVSAEEVKKADDAPATEATELDESKVWFFPALVYTLIGLDRSMFELYAWESGNEFTYNTVRTPAPVATFDGVDISKSAWFHTVQGLDQSLSLDFIDYMSSFLFRDPSGAKEWAINFTEVRMRDPVWKGDPRPVDIVFALPECRTNGKKVVVTTEPGPELGPVSLGVYQP